jgi:hypothetical protein
MGNKGERIMEYLYSVTCTYDNDTTPKWVGRYSDALSAVETYQKFVDWGTAKEYSTINLSEPSGKMHTKIFYKDGTIGGK